MKRTFIKVYDKIILSILGISGLFTSCFPMYGMPAEYGMPHATFEIKGTITDKESQKPIDKIRVIRQYNGNSEYGDTLYTSNEGKFEFVFGDFPYDESVFNLKVEDVDGQENDGNFETKEIEVIFTNKDKVEDGSGNWYEGKFSKNLDIELEQKAE